MDDSIRDSLEKAGLWERFRLLPPSHQKEYLKWVNEAKKPETKERRIAKMIEMLRAK